MAQLVTFTNKIDKDIKKKFGSFCSKRGYKIHSLLEKAMIDEMKIVELKEDSFDFEKAYKNINERVETTGADFMELSGLNKKRKAGTRSKKA